MFVATSSGHTTDTPSPRSCTYAGERLAQTDDAELRHAVRDQRREAERPGGRRRVHEVSGSALEHVRQEAADRPDVGVQVDVEDLVPLLLRDDVRRAAESDAGVRHEQVAVALPLDRRIDEIEDLLLLRRRPSRTTSAFTPSASTSAPTAFAPSSLMSDTTTSAPCFANSIAHARPIPDAAPVTTADGALPLDGHPGSSLIRWWR